MLENCLSHLEVEIPFRPIYSDMMQSKACELPIYHVHGFLPRKDDKKELDLSNRITLSEDIYHQLYADVYYWSNIVQINKYTNNTCLFIGTSFTDPNLRRLLDVAKKHRDENSIPHYIFKQRYDKQEVKDKIEQKISASEEITNLDEEFDSKIEKLAQDLIDIMEGFEEDDALSFGVNIIWYDDYDEIPINLQKIRGT